MRVHMTWEEKGKKVEHGFTFELKHEDPKVLWYTVEFVVKEAIKKDKAKQEEFAKKKKGKKKV